MKILLISNYKRGVGGINAQVDLLQQFINQEDGWQADIFSTKGNPLRRCIAFLKLLCQARRYDILHIHACSYWGMVPPVMGVIAGKLWRKRIIITYHGGGAEEYFAKHAAFVRRWLSRADEVIVLSGFLKEIFDQHQIHCVVIPNIVVLRPQTERTTTIAPKFISIRHLEPLYNIPCVLQAYEQVLKQYPEASLDILGQGSMRAELETYVQEHHLTGVTFGGQVPNDKIYDYFAKEDGAGRFLLDRYAPDVEVTDYESLMSALDSVPQKNIAPFINNLMKTSFSKSVLSKFDKIVDDANELMNIEAQHVDECVIANNGVIYILNDVFGPGAYEAVSAPTLVNDNMGVMRNVISQLRYDYYLLAMDANYFLFF